MRRIDLVVANLDTTPEQEDALVDALWSLAQSLHPDADLMASAGPEER